MPDPRTPDAVMAPATTILTAPDPEQAARSLHDRAREVLNVPRAFIRDQGDQRFITGSPFCTINHARGTALEGMPRYTWEDQPDGWKFGYLTEAAKPHATDQ